MIGSLLENTKKAAHEIANLSEEKKHALLFAIAERLESEIPRILSANAKDMAAMDPSDSKYDRTLLTEDRMRSFCQACRNVADLPTPVGKELSEYVHPAGVKIKKITVPLGVIGAIYEARPNVTIDIIALGLRSGNAVVLKGGSDAQHSNQVIVEIVHQVLENYEISPPSLEKSSSFAKASDDKPEKSFGRLSAEIVTLLPAGRDCVPEFLAAKDSVDILIPRGSKGLIDFVQANSQIPTIETGAGVCHTYVEKSAEISKAARVIENAKITRPSVCNSLDTIVVDREVAEGLLTEISAEFLDKKVGVWADEIAFQILEKLDYPYLHKATEEDFGREFLSLNCSVKVVNGIDEALDHIAMNSSKHSEAIMTENEKIRGKFLSSVDAACVYANASTRFTDGEMFGLGAEIGISTQKLHARGPFALEKLVTEKWIATGDYALRN